MMTILKGKEFKVHEYVSALKRVMKKHQVHDNHLRMLQIHYSAQERAITVPELGEKAGYMGYHGVNLQYGYIGRWVSEELANFPKDLNGRIIWTLGISWGRRKDATSMWEWIMYENFALALLNLNLVK